MFGEIAKNKTSPEEDGGSREPQRERESRFFGDDFTAHDARRSLSQSLNKDQLKKYDKIINKNIKRERHSLSHTRYNKMKAMIMREVRDAIQEADYEPSASVNDYNLI